MELVSDASHALHRLRIGTNGKVVMLDVILLAAGFGFFVVAIAYQYACDRI